MASRILLFPFGAEASDLTAALAESLPLYIGLPVSVGEPLPYPEGSYNPFRGQHLAHPFLRSLPRTEGYNVGLVDEDIYVPGLNFVFGLADPATRRAVVALRRLRGGPFFERVLKEVLHELGHLMGLRHCRDPRCVMAFSNTLMDTDLKGPDFCQRCAAEIRRVLELEKATAED